MTFYLLLLFVVYKITNSKNETRLFLNGKNLDNLQSASLFTNTTNIFEQPLEYQITNTNYSDTNTVVIKDENPNEIPNNKNYVKPCLSKRRRQNSLLAYTMATAIILM